MEAKQISQNLILSKIDELPTLPTIVYELNRVINDPMSSTKEVERLMANDLSLTTKVLRLVNSAYYAIPGGVTSLGRAIGYLGFDTVNQLVLAASIFSTLEVNEEPAFDLQGFWKHAVGVGIASETIGKFMKVPTAHELFTAGIVHDMGKIAMHTIDKDITAQIVAKAKADNISYLEAEIALELPTHPQVGFLLAQKWGLARNIQTIIKFHHQKDPNIRGFLAADLSQSVDIVLLANILIHALKFGNSGHNSVTGIPRDVIDRLNLTADLKKVVQEVKVALEQASEFLNVLARGVHE